MKKNLFLQFHSWIIPFIFATTVFTGPHLKAGILFQEDFETDGLGIRYFATDTFTDGADDYFIRTDGISGASGIPQFTDFSGEYFWAAEDTDASDNPSGLSILDFSPIDLENFPSIKISFSLGAGSTAAFDSVDDFVLLQYRVDAGSWNTALAFQNDGTTFNSGLYQDMDLDGIGEGTAIGLALQNFSTPIIPVSGSSLDLRIDTVMNGGNEAIAFDNISVTGIPEPAHAAFLLGILTIFILLLRRKFLPEREIENQA